jgi:molybdopterin biosynthesis enzyme
VRDDEEEIVAALRKGLRSCEAVVATAGSSVGEKDLVPACINKLGKPGMLVHGIAMRPAMPTGLAVVKGKPILSLPGFPVSAIFGFRVFGRPLIARLLGSEVIDDPVVKAVLREKISNSPGFRAFVRVALRRTPDGLIAEPLRVQRSSVLMSMVAANGIIVVPEDLATIEAGQVVEVDVIGEISS